MLIHIIESISSIGINKKIFERLPTLIMFRYSVFNWYKRRFYESSGFCK